MSETLDPLEFVMLLRRALSDLDRVEFSVAFENIQVDVFPFSRSRLVHNHAIGKRRLAKQVGGLVAGWMGFHTHTDEKFSVESDWRAARIMLPETLMLDLLMESSPAVLAQDQPPGELEQCYSWSATVPERISEKLGEDVQRRLCALARRTLVCMTDDFLDLGPIPPEPEAAADVVSEAVWLVAEMVDDLSMPPPEQWD